ncbi:MAG: type II toxin-antitoxin system PrlF family antitoxin [Vulcanimicrobiota bacterium]
MHSIVTAKGQTTIPRSIRQALKIQPGDRLEYRLEGEHVIISVLPGLRELKGALASDLGADLSFNQIRAISGLTRAQS